MNLVRAVAALLAIAIGAAHAQTRGNEVFNTVGSIAPFTHPLNGTVATPNVDNCTDALPATGTVNGLAICRFMEMTTAGAGSVVLPGHSIGGFGELNHNGSGTLPLGIGVEGQCLITNHGTVNECASLVSHMSANNGTMPIYDGLLLDFDSNTGTVGQINEIKCNVSAPGALTGQNNCVNNTDPGADIRNAGRYYNSTGQELAPSGFYPRLGATRYYWGILPNAALNPLTVGGSYIWFAPWNNVQRLTVTHIGTQITTGAAGGLCQVALYGVSGSGAPTLILHSTSLPATAAGLVDYTIPGGQQLDAGVYETAVECNNAAIATASYVDNGVLQAYGSSVSAGAMAFDTTAIQGIGTFGTWSTTASLSFLAAGGVQPFVYLHQ